MARATMTPSVGGIPRVDLMPRVEIERRDQAATLRAWGWILLAAVVCLLLIVAGTLYLNWAAANRLTAEQARTRALQSESAELSDVSVALSTQGGLEAFRSDAMSTDIDWASVYTTLQGALPSGVTLAGFELMVGGVPAPDVDAGAQEGLRGTLTVTSSTPVDIAQLIRAYRAVPGVIDAGGTEVSTSAGGDDAYTSQLTIVFDQSIYSGDLAGGDE